MTYYKHAFLTDFEIELFNEPMMGHNCGRQSKIDFGHQSTIYFLSNNRPFNAIVHSVYIYLLFSSDSFKKKISTFFRVKNPASQKKNEYKHQQVNKISAIR